MARKSVRKAPEPGAWKILRGGNTIPRGLVDLRVAEARRMLQAGRADGRGVAGQMARYFGLAQGEAPRISAAPGAERGVEGLLALHEKLARRKLAAPRVPAEVGGLMPGRITVKVTPPFDYAFTIHTPIIGATQVAATATKNGQLSSSAVSDRSRFNAGSAYAEAGIFFHPLSAGRLRVSASPAFSFQWWTNSLGTRAVRSEGTGMLAIFGLEANPSDPRNFTVVSSAGTHFEHWDETSTGEVQFDVGSTQAPVSVELDVSRSLVYVLFVSAHTHVEGGPWPGSLAGAMMSVTVPSLTWEFDPALVLTPG